MRISWRRWPSWARYSGRILEAYRHDLRALFQWAADHNLPVLEGHPHPPGAVPKRRWRNGVPRMFGDRHSVFFDLAFEPSAAIAGESRRCVNPMGELISAACVFPIGRIFRGYCHVFGLPEGLIHVVNANVAT